MSVALELDRGARERGLSSVFVPTGQTGIAIAGWGIAVDAVVADFIAGAAERLVVEGAEPRRPPLGRRAGLARASRLLRGHARPLPRERAALPRPLPPGRATSTSRDLPAHPDSRRCPTLVELHERIALPARPAQGGRRLALNTRRLDEEEAQAAIDGGRGGDRIARRRPCPFWTWPFTGCNPASCQSGIRQT